MSRRKRRRSVQLRIITRTALFEPFNAPSKYGARCVPCAALTRALSQQHLVVVLHVTYNSNREGELSGSTELDAPSPPSVAHMLLIFTGKTDSEYGA